MIRQYRCLACAPFLALFGLILTTAYTLALLHRAHSIDCRGEKTRIVAIVSQEAAATVREPRYNSTRAPCLAPTPCSIRKTRHHNADLNIWDQVHLSNLNGWNETGQRNFCGLPTTRRVFEESGIELQALAKLQPCDLFNVIQAKTLWLIGDSQQYTLLMALAYFLRAFSRTKNVIRFKPIGIPSIDHVLTFDTNTPEGIELVNETRVCHLRIVRLTQNAVQYAMEILSWAYPDFRSHIVVLNMGLHYYFAPQQLGSDMETLARYRREVRDSMGPDHLPLTVWFDTPPQHFDTSGWKVVGDVGLRSDGGYNHTVKGLDTKECAPFNKDFLSSGGRGIFNSISDEFAPNVSDHHLKIWDVSKRSHFAHVSRAGDCTHYCRPGVPELWVYLLSELLVRMQPKCD